MGQAFQFGYDYFHVVPLTTKQQLPQVSSPRKSLGCIIRRTAARSHSGRARPADLSSDFRWSLIARLWGKSNESGSELEPGNLETQPGETTESHRLQLKCRTNVDPVGQIDQNDSKVVKIFPGIPETKAVERSGHNDSNTGSGEVTVYPALQSLLRYSLGQRCSWEADQQILNTLIQRLFNMVSSPLE